MAEFLVYAGTNWMDELSVNELGLRLFIPGFKAKYNARNLPGDIIKVYPDGTCKEKPAPNSKMHIIKAPGLPVDKSLEGKQVDADGKLIAKCKHRIDLNNVQLTDKTAFLSQPDVQNLIIDKSK